jgi:hypothetical protein
MENSNTGYKNMLIWVKLLILKHQFCHELPNRTRKVIIMMSIIYTTKVSGLYTNDRFGTATQPHKLNFFEALLHSRKIQAQQLVPHSYL